MGRAISSELDDHLLRLHLDTPNVSFDDGPFGNLRIELEMFADRFDDQQSAASRPRIVRRSRRLEVKSLTQRLICRYYGQF